MSDNEKSVSLINFDGLSQIGCALLDKISNAVGWVATHDTPNRIAVKQYIEDIQNSDLDPLLKAAKISRAKRDIKEYCNQAKIISDAIPQLDSASNPSQLDDQWLTIFMDKIRFISSDELQAIWSRVLSQECNEPNSIPLKLIEILSYISVEQAKAFRQLCQCSFSIYKINSSYILRAVPLIPYSNYKRFFKKQNLTYARLKDLDFIGLISMTERPLSINVLSSNAKYRIVIDQRKFLIQSKPGKILPVGNVLLTSAGDALSDLIDIQPPEGFVNLCLNYWKKNHVILTDASESQEAKEVENTANQN